MGWFVCFFDKKRAVINYFFIFAIQNVNIYGLYCELSSNYEKKDFNP